MILVFALLLLAVTVQSSTRCLNLPKDCAEIHSKKSGVYTIYPGGPAQVYCDMSTDGGRWTVIQRRMDGTVNFYRPWAQYKAGFGDASGEYWLGLENMHLLTKDKPYELRVDMEDFEGKKVFEFHSTFSVGSEATGYKLLVAGYKKVGGAGDSLSFHNGRKFSTFDKDQDAHKENCAVTYYGAFWYKNCHRANPNGVYLWGKTSRYATGVVFASFREHHYSLKAVAMKIRPVSDTGV